MSEKTVTGHEIPSCDQKTVIKGNPSQYVKLNVGGSLFYTTIGTLIKNDTMLRAMFSGRMEVLTDSEGDVLFIENVLGNKTEEFKKTLGKRLVVDGVKLCGISPDG
ncbi:hypothetical protein QYM36_002218 [Artemia franciscana]|uniref:Potassium channel tetramerisation-type BTB domain-containing protein n=1 Tax=Artemia franciscana TaxID=6661 RepID=A0AA88I963_ARTSF|nr:hypothetical protein QYM36_002218 [Artemia franciscana]